jgi:peptidoglycan/LPS O-acetylase OafA/YrhL
MDAVRPMNRHIPVLDGLRGLAIIAVIVCHVNWSLGGPFIPGRVNGPLAMVFGWGWVGVDLFFVLSGFLITGILYDAKGCDRYFRNFYARRMLRIMPLYFGFLFFAIFVLPRLPCKFCTEGVVSNADALSLGLYYYNVRLAFTGHTLSFFHPFWSLAIEEHFYLFWPWVVWALRRRALMRLCFVVAATSCLLRVIVLLSGAWPLSAFFLTPCRLDGLLAGSFVALAWRDPAEWAHLQRYARQLVLGAGFLLLGIALGQRHFLPNVTPQQVGHEAAVNGTLVLTVGIAALTMFFAGVIALAVDATEGSRLQRVLESPSLRAIGKYSYAIYVFHSMILLATVSLLSPLAHVPAFIAKPVAVLWVLSASFVAAWLSFHLYEKHFLLLKGFFEYRHPDYVDTPVPSQRQLYMQGQRL